MAIDESMGVGFFMNATADRVRAVMLRLNENKKVVVIEFKAKEKLSENCSGSMIRPI